MNKAIKLVRFNRWVHPDHGEVMDVAEVGKPFYMIESMGVVCTEIVEGDDNGGHYVKLIFSNNDEVKQYNVNTVLYGLKREADESVRV